MIAPPLGLASPEEASSAPQPHPDPLTRQRWLVASIVVGLAASVLLPGLSTFPLVDPDEGRHAEIARELFAAQRWQDRVLPRLGGEPYRDKPILFYWLAASAYGLLGPTTAAARLPAVVAAVLTVVATALAAMRAFGLRGGLVAGIALLTAPGFVALGRAATLDMLLTACITLGTLAAWRWATVGSATALAAAAAAAAFGTLAKGLVAPALIGGTVLVWLMVGGRPSRLRLGHVALAATTYTVIVGPWAATTWVLDPDYLREQLLTHHLRRFLGGGPGRLHSQSAVVYLPSFLLGFFPWILLVPAAAVALWHRPPGGPAAGFCVTWLAVIVGFFSASSGKLPTYMLPAFPPLAMLIGGSLAGIVTGAAPARPDKRTVPCPERLARWGMLAAAAILLLLPLVLRTLARTRYEGVLVPAAYWSAVLLPLALAALWRAARWSLRDAAVLLAIALILVPLLFAQLAAPRVAGLTGTQRVAGLIVERAPAAPVVVYGLALPSLAFNLRRHVTAIDRPGALARYVEQNPGTVVVTTPRHVATVTRTTGLVPWDQGPRRVLLGPRKAMIVSRGS